MIGSLPVSLYIGFEMQMIVAGSDPGLETCKVFSVYNEFMRVGTTEISSFTPILCFKQVCSLSI